MNNPFFYLVSLMNEKLTRKERTEVPISDIERACVHIAADPAYANRLAAMNADEFFDTLVGQMRFSEEITDVRD